MRFLRIEVLIIFAVLSSLSLSSCEDFGDPPPRIIPGVSIDGIRLGFTREQVVQIAGKPDAIGLVDGPYGAWELYGYGTFGTQGFRFSVCFIEVPGSDLGPVDLVGTGTGYDGTTREGVGIGWHRHEVHRVLGLPVNSTLGDTANGGWNDYYCFNKTNMLFRYNRNTLWSITLGPLVPEPFYPRCD
jgi:hypothetical protein